jgi:hypothetical protein
MGSELFSGGSNLFQIRAYQLVRDLIRFHSYVALLPHSNNLSFFLSFCVRERERERESQRVGIDSTVGDFEEEASF